VQLAAGAGEVNELVGMLIYILGAQTATTDNGVSSSSS
jgi:hypothetical protein